MGSHSLRRKTRPQILGSEGDRLIIVAFELGTPVCNPDEEILRIVGQKPERELGASKNLDF